MGLLGELKQEQSKYIEVEKAIEIISKQTKTLPQDTITYLLMNGIDSNIPVYTCNERYRFEQCEDNNRFIYEDTKKALEGFNAPFSITRYFLISDLENFSPINKHNITFTNTETDKNYYDQFNNCDDIKENFDFLTVLEASLLWCGVPRKEIEYESEQCKPKGDENGLNRNTFIHPYISCVEPRCLLLHSAYENNILPMGRDGGDSFLKGDDHIAHHRRTIKIADLKEFIIEHYPNDKPKTLFNEPSNNQDIKTLKDGLIQVKKENKKLEESNNKLNQRLDKAKEVFKQQQSEIEHLRAELAQAQKENEQLAKQLTNTQGLSVTSNNFYDWQSMNEYKYPPELHLAIMIWRKIYIDREIQNNHIDNHSDRFNTICQKIGVNKNNVSNAMIERLQTITTPQGNKTKKDVDKLKTIKGLYLK